MQTRFLPLLGALCVLVPLAARPHASTEDIVLTAAHAVDLHGHWSRVADASAANGLMLASPDSGWQHTVGPLANPEHYVDFQFVPEPDTPYRVWLRLRASSGSKFNDSVFVQFSDARDTKGVQRYRLGTTQGLLVNRQACNGCAQDGWGWYDGGYWLTQASTLTFAAGSQTLRVQTREDGVEIDQIVLSPDTYLRSAPGKRDLDTTIFSAPPAFTTFDVPPGGDLQGAIDAAAPGDVIVLHAGASYVGNFRLPAKADASDDRYVTIRSSAPDATLPAEGVRISPEYSAALPKLRSPNTLPALATLPYASHYRIQFVEFLGNANGAGNIIALGDATKAQDTLGVVPHHIVLDRVYVHGDELRGQKRGIALNSAHTTIINSYISEIKAVGQDSQAIGGWNGPGPFVISNNYLEAAGENVMFGGADPAIPELVPSDITVAGNHFFKPLSWRGSQWTVKNLFELKSAQRVVIDGNLMENNWLAAQTGYAVLFKSVNQDGAAPWSVVQDVTFSNNIVRHVSAAINILGRDTRYPAIVANTIVIRNNLFYDVSGATFGGAGRLLQINGGADITIDHNTVIADGSAAVMADGNATERFAFTNNLLHHNLYGIKGSGTATGNSTIARYFPDALFIGGLYIGGKPSLYPVGNYFAATVADVAFVDYTGGDYRLSPSCIYQRSASDGSDPGVDYAGLDDAVRALQGR